MTSISIEGNGAEPFHNKVFNNRLPYRPVISSGHVDQLALKSICPNHALGVNPVRIDLGKCIFCRLCADQFPNKIRFSTDTNVATNVRERLIVLEGDDAQICVDRTLLRPEVAQYEQMSLSLFLINASNVPVSELPIANGESIRVANFANEANGILLFGRIDDETQENFHTHYHALRPPRLIILAGWEALEVFETSDSLAKYQIDLFVPGEGLCPSTLVSGIKQLFNKDIIH